MQLIMSPLSPYVRKVRVLIREAGQSEEVSEVKVSTTALAPDQTVIESHPTGRIPVLIRDNGKPIYDSRVITRYLDELWGAGLYPSNRLWDVLTLEAAAEGILDSALLMSYEVRLRPEDMQWADWLDAQWAKITNALAMLEKDVGEFGAQPVDMGQIALGCALGYLDLRQPARGWRDGHPGLAAWYATFAERASMKATVPA